MSFAPVPATAAWRHRGARSGFEVVYFQAGSGGCGSRGGPLRSRTAIPGPSARPALPWSGWSKPTIRGSPCGRPDWPEYQPTPEGATSAATQSRSNSLPSTSCITRHDSLSSSASSSRTRTAPSAISRAHSASSTARRSSPTSPVPTRTSRCSRFLTTLPSGTRWKNSRGPAPEGSMHANHEPRSSGGSVRSKSSQVANPSGGGGTTYPSTSHQKRATRSGSAQSKVTWNCLTDAIGPP